MCLECNDIVSLIHTERICHCGKYSRNYLDRLNAVYFGPCVPLGIANRSLIDGISNQRKNGMGRNFNAFVIPEHCETFTKNNPK